MERQQHYGFTLIELSIVLVVIGLLVGGVLVGRDLIKASELRGTLSQKDKFTTAVRTFQLKYNALPGDMPPADAARLGFFTFIGTGAGDWLGNNNGFIGDFEYEEAACNGECGAMWRHLSDAKLIEGNYGATLQNDGDLGWAGIPVGESLPTAKQSLYMPKAKAGIGYWGVSKLDASGIGVLIANRSQNMFTIGLARPGDNVNTAVLSPIDVFQLDAKIDDGKPNTGKVAISPITLGGAPIYWSDGNTDVYDDPVTDASLACTIGGSSYNDVVVKYNIDPAKGGNNISCQPAFLW